MRAKLPADVVSLGCRGGQEGTQEEAGPPRGALRGGESCGGSCQGGKAQERAGGESEKRPPTPAGDPHTEAAAAVGSHEEGAPQPGRAAENVLEYAAEVLRQCCSGSA